MNQSTTITPLPVNTEPPLNVKKRFNFWRYFWLSFLVVSLAYAWYCFYAPANDIAWAESHAAAQRQATSSGKPIILYFTGKWCVPCRIMKRQVWADDEVARSVNSQFIPVAIDLDDADNAGLLAQYNVSSVPVTIITDPQGNALRWRAGGMGKSEFLDLLRGPTPSATRGE